MKQAVFKINKNSTNNEKYLSVKNNNSNNSNSNSNSIYSQKPRKIVENIYYFKR